MEWGNQERFPVQRRLHLNEVRTWIASQGLKAWIHPTQSPNLAIRHGLRRRTLWVGFEPLLLQNLTGAACG